jgi:hypothetical protein
MLENYPCSRAKADCGWTFAWASTEIAACCMIEVFVRFAVSLATSMLVSVRRPVRFRPTGPAPSVQPDGPTSARLEHKNSKILTDPSRIECTDAFPAGDRRGE